MLVTFRSQAHADITMFGDVAVSLLQMMGHSGAVPGAILAEDIPAALDRLKKAIATDRGTVAADTAGKAQDEDEDEESSERPVSLAHHAFPLLELLAAATAKKCNVMWDRTA